MGANNWGDCPQCGSTKTLAEYYELGIYKNIPEAKKINRPVFMVDYGSYCIKCGFKFSFRHIDELKDMVIKNNEN